MNQLQIFDDIDGQFVEVDFSEIEKSMLEYAILDELFSRWLGCESFTVEWSKKPIIRSYSEPNFPWIKRK